MIEIVDDFIEKRLRSDLFDRARSVGGERKTLWSDDELLAYVNDAAAQWAADTLAYRRNITVNISPNKPVFYTGFEVLEMVRGRFTDSTGNNRHLHYFNLDAMEWHDDYGSVFVTNHELMTRVGPAQAITRDADPASLRLYPIPPVAGTLELNVVAIPQQLHCGMPMPSENRQDLNLMRLWSLYLAYSKQDADTQDLDRAQQHFNNYMALMPTRKHEYDRSVRGGGLIASSW